MIWSNHALINIGAWLDTGGFIPHIDFAIKQVPPRVYEGREEQRFKSQNSSGEPPEALLTSGSRGEDDV